MTFTTKSTGSPAVFERNCGSGSDEAVVTEEFAALIADAHLTVAGKFTDPFNP